MELQQNIFVKEWSNWSTKLWESRRALGVTFEGYEEDIVSKFVSMEERDKKETKLKADGKNQVGKQAHQWIYYHMMWGGYRENKMEVYQAGGGQRRSSVVMYSRNQKKRNKASRVWGIVGW